MRQSIEVIDGPLYQWDTGQKVRINCPEAAEIHFALNGSDDAAVLEIYEVNGDRVADIPNELLQHSGHLLYFLVKESDAGEQTKHADTLFIHARPKPEDYVYTQTEIKRWETLEERIRVLEDGSVQPDLSVNDPSDPRHVLGRTHYEYDSRVEIPVSGVWEDEDGNGVAEGFFLTASLGLEVGKTYTVDWNGVEYQCVAQDLSSLQSGVICLGDAYKATEGQFGTSTGEPFTMVDFGADMGGGMYGMIVGTDTTAGSGEVPFTIYAGAKAVKKLENKYLDLDWLPTSEVKETCIAEEKTVTNALGAGSITEEKGGFPDLTKNDVYAGQKLAVYWDGERYEVEVLSETTTETGTEVTNLLAGCFVNGTILFNLFFRDNYTMVGYNDDGPHVASVYALETEYNKIPEGFLPESVVLTEPQTLTEEQRAQARANISEYEWHEVTSDIGTVNIAISSNIKDWESLVAVDDASGHMSGTPAIALLAYFSNQIAMSPRNALIYFKNYISKEIDAIFESGALVDGKGRFSFLVKAKSGILTEVSAGQYNDTQNYLMLSNTGVYASGSVRYDKTTETITHNGLIFSGGDNTLTKSGLLADAKATGDAIATAKTELTEKIDEKIPTPQTASVGQVISVKAVDEDGKPTEWECVEKKSKITKYELLFSMTATAEDEELVGVDLTSEEYPQIEEACLVFVRLTSDTSFVDIWRRLAINGKDYSQIKDTRCGQLFVVRIDTDGLIENGCEVSTKGAMMGSLSYSPTGLQINAGFNGIDMDQSTKIYTHEPIKSISLHSWTSGLLVEGALLEIYIARRSE